MSTAPSSPPHGGSTRQQLAELDALLQRMLNLPLSGDDPAKSTAAPAVERPAPPPPVEVAPIPSQWTVELTAPPPAPRTSPTSEAFHLRTAASVTGDIRLTNSGPPIQIFAPPVSAPRPLVVAPSAPQPAQAPAKIPTAPGVVRPRAPVMLWPLVAINFLGFRLLRLLGPIGRLLERPLGRDVLGALGLIGLAAALTWLALDWFGWNF
jgi:hypothetical protein